MCARACGDAAVPADAQVGSDDYEIRIFQREEVVSEATETDRVTALTPIRLKR